LHTCLCIFFGWLNSNLHLNSIVYSLFKISNPFSFPFPLSSLWPSCVRSPATKVRFCALNFPCFARVRLFLTHLAAVTSSPHLFVAQNWKSRNAPQTPPFVAQLNPTRSSPLGPVEPKRPQRSWLSRQRRRRRPSFASAPSQPRVVRL
jgi:hypothetical protein